MLIPLLPFAYKAHSISLLFRQATYVLDHDQFKKLELLSVKIFLLDINAFYLGPYIQGINLRLL